MGLAVWAVQATDSCSVLRHVVKLIHFILTYEIWNWHVVENLHQILQVGVMLLRLNLGIFKAVCISSSRKICSKKSRRFQFFVNKTQSEVNVDSYMTLHLNQGNIVHVVHQFLDKQQIKFRLYLSLCLHKSALQFRKLKNNFDAFFCNLDAILLQYCCINDSRPVCAFSSIFDNVMLSVFIWTCM